MLNNNEKTRMDRGREMMDILDPSATPRLYKMLGDVNPDLADFVIKHAYGEVIARPALSLKIREISTISALIGMGTAERELKIHLKKALHIGIPKEELAEMMLHLSIYAGYPAAINASLCLKEVLEEIQS